MKAVHDITSRALGPASAFFVPSPAEHLKHMAWECRRLAALLSDAHTRRQMIRLADCFERLARVREDNGEESQLPEYADD